MKKKQKKRIKNKKVWFYATVTLVILGVSLMSYGIYASNPSMNTHTLGGSVIEGSFNVPLNVERMKVMEFNIQDFDPDAIDQSQFENPADFGLYVGYSPLDPSLLYIIEQIGWNDREPWNGFLMKVLRHGNPTEVLYVGVMDDFQSDPNDPSNWDFIGYLDSASLPESDTWYWVGSDTQITGIVTNDMWGIVALSLNNGEWDHFWKWGASDVDVYARGNTRYWDDGASSWKVVSEGTVDTCFVTYTVPNGNGEEPPDIEISTSYTVIPMFFGGLSFIAAVATGSKFYFFM